MAKEVKASIKLQVPAGQANPAPPVGPALGQHGVNIMEFCRAFNEKTKGEEGTITPVVITVYTDHTFTFVTKSPPAAVLLKKAAGIATGSPDAKRQRVGQVSRLQVRQIAKTKLADLNAGDLDAAERIILGTARSMGIEVVDGP